jgi:hypothetical protein
MAMTEKQLEFWRALTAPFPSQCYETRKGSEGREFTYLKSRTIMNRLDDVCGPDGWDVRFEDTSRGVICELTLLVPGTGESNRLPVKRSWGGGPHDKMEKDKDAEYKTAFSNSFKVTAALFGIGRELYGEGMPAYCADLHNTTATGIPQGSGPGVGAPPRTNGAPRAEPGLLRNEEEHAVPGDRNSPGKPPLGNVRAVYPWSLKCGEHFFGENQKYKVLNWMQKYAEGHGQSNRTNEWDEGFLNECLGATLAWIKKLPNYRGEFGEPVQIGNPVAASGNGQQATPGPTEQQDISSLRHAVARAAEQLLHVKTGRTPGSEETFALLGEVASSVANAAGHRGEVLESLKGCKDRVWLGRILNKLIQDTNEAKQLQAASVPVDDDIPF